ncbi:hypothetical protein D477_011906 [Arthrobacter crystallopoietes BAB-32]|uniref:Uncharacterized protein n=1 Tax=Arthrobacter crystallopoietes BAB-32 TaxID=1246476 RepID=N1UY75_9MICC|nr:DUF5058 family protein [Arthrobacter crystallopoietes]EMY34020.1 hypothetical protein D477_011906 [Arthrobacter crystallopoietes BAB-32]
MPHTVSRAVSAAGESTDVLAVANMPVLWICAAGVFAVIIIQSMIYMKAARKAAPAAGITPSELKLSFRSGAVAAIGPSLAVVIVAIALLAVFGTPAVLVRIGLIGSAAYETGAASIAAGTAGAELGGPTYTQNAFAIAFFAMSMGGAMWMLATLILTPLMKRGGSKLAKVNPAAMSIVPGAALLGAFISLGVAEVPKSMVHVVALVTSAAVMGLCAVLGRGPKRGWLREWSLGFAIVTALVVAFLVHTAGAPAA